VLVLLPQVVQGFGCYNSGCHRLGTLFLVIGPPVVLSAPRRAFAFLYVYNCTTKWYKSQYYLTGIPQNGIIVLIIGICSVCCVFWYTRRYEGCEQSSEGSGSTERDT
jgi:hypothetical protein